jgi:hypothetical protein
MEKEGKPTTILTNQIKFMTKITVRKKNTFLQIKSYCPPHFVNVCVICEVLILLEIPYIHHNAMSTKQILTKLRQTIP